jgi:integrase
LFACISTGHASQRTGGNRWEGHAAVFRIALPKPLLGPEYWDAYRAALADYVAAHQAGARTEIGVTRTKVSSVAHAFVLYTGCASFKNGLAESTQGVHFNILSRWRDQWGDRLLKYLQRRHVIEWLNERADTPFTAQVFLKVMRRMMQYCVSIDLVETDPTVGVKALTPRSDGHHTWTDDEIVQYQNHHPLGSNARTAFELGICTSRVSDVVRTGHQHVRQITIEGRLIDVIHVKQQKRKKDLDIPISQELATALDGVRHDHLTFLISDWGKPYTAKGWSKHFRDWCNQAGLPERCVFHGSRAQLDIR